MLQKQPPANVAVAVCGCATTDDKNRTAENAKIAEKKIPLRALRSPPLNVVDVIALPHALRRIVVLPEDLQQLPVADHLRIEHDEHDLVVPGHARADLAVRRVRCMTAGVPDRGAVDAAKLPEFPLGAPEAPH